MKTIIIGGVAGGASAAARLRRLDEGMEITIYERSGYISYANCGLPYYIGETIKNKAELTLQTPESFFNRFNIHAKVNHEVIEIEFNKKTLTVRNLKSGEEFQDHYDKLLLSPGAKPVKPNIPGMNLVNIFTLRTVEDTFQIYDFIKKNNAKSAIIVGGGFIGIEMAENLRHLGLDITIVEAAPQVLSILDSDMVPQVHDILRKNGINIILENSITAFEKHEEKITATLANKSKISADLVLLAIGVTPDTSLATKANLKTGIKGSIIVNDRMETSASDIYAVGDAVQIEHFITKDKTLIPLAGPANKQGRIAADNITGGDSRYKGSQGSSIIKLFDMAIATTGINERQAIAAKINYEKVIISPSSHASYYPGGKAMTLKVLFEKETNRILGAQIVGFDGVDKRIDVIATAIRSGMKATDLTELELSYAPPFSSAKDPVNMAGYVIENLINGKVKQFYYEEVNTLKHDRNAFLLDTRTPAEYAHGHADGFANIPVDELRTRIAEIPKDKTIYIMCQSGIRSYIACCILSGNGYDCYNFAGGYRFYSMVENERLASTECYNCGMDK
ncbi:FAD-dependent oxidoreductase [Lachnospiraceae bacterium OttesenSCG-928-D06]|nr:FAD-dependent oxidoreductase [Lachnospiraceae bacterium OttesenSCG-928-D06]